MGQVIIEGLAETGQALKEFGDEIATKYLKHSTRAAALVFLEEAKQVSPVLSGTLQEAEATFKRPGAPPDEVEYVVGIRHMKKSKQAKKVVAALRALGISLQDDPAMYGRFLEFGFHHTGTGEFVKYPFMRPAFESKKTESIEVFAADLAKGVDMAAQQVARNA